MDEIYKLLAFLGICHESAVIAKTLDEADHFHPSFILGKESISIRMAAVDQEHTMCHKPPLAWLLLLAKSYCAKNLLLVTFRILTSTKEYFLSSHLESEETQVSLPQIK